MKRVHVAAAVIRAADGRVLIAKRPDDKHQGGLWEFPGGKVEAGEAVPTALARELEEELGICPTAARPLIQVRHDYPDKQVLLDVWEVSAFSGEPHGAEGQPLAWVAPRQLGDYEFPAANRPIVAAARLPERYLITPDGLAAPTLLRGVQAALADGIRLLQLRAPAMFDAQYRDLAVDVQGLCAGRAQLMLKGPLEWLGDFPAAGWHLTSAQLRQLAAAGRPLPAQRWLAASCHGAEELALAAQLGVDFVTLSPLQATASHPGAQPLGWARARELLQGFDRPAYLLGGVGPADVERAWQVGAQGVAGIRAFWPG
ncbi:Nudix family hydrolase [Pseudomonas lalucatii]|uniref:8-oxo-dGTP diphosphatase n=1 Tax=Pseudomonas lalucatii TaxID=1424203 RepID=A0ABS5Q4W0_9PSED|nr:Nudix family hydrolase [Pseudomonas lalucatii]MBS7663797.1 Nudix family hydrolase [Pseudomonas lalucatii]QVM86820.1 Nudix family hydrolase [Pseudomonas lalucatii]